ncbi:MAG: hypothetical protein Q8O46_04500 [bacterium]|nr:hypothetical protein [bacterium]
MDIMVLRVFFSFLLLLAVLFMPFWLSGILALIGIAFFRTYWEAVVLLFFSDMLLGTSETKFLNFTLVSSALTLLVLILFQFLKEKLKFYNKY